MTGRNPADTEDFPSPAAPTSPTAGSTPNSALRRYSSCPIAQKMTSGTSATSRNSTACGQLSAAGLNSNTFPSQLLLFAA
jgi:hypothetical protein